MREQPYVISCSNDGSSDEDDNGDYPKYATGSGSHIATEMRFSLPPMPQKFTQNDSGMQFSSSMGSRPQQMDWTKSSVDKS